MNDEWIKKLYETVFSRNLLVSFSHTIISHFRNETWTSDLNLSLVHKKVPCHCVILALTEKSESQWTAGQCSSLFLSARNWYLRSQITSPSASGYANWPCIYATKSLRIIIIIVEKVSVSYLKNNRCSTAQRHRNLHALEVWHLKPTVSFFYKTGFKKLHEV
jgi:hypothetical protein